MAAWEDAQWDPTDTTGLARADRRSGPYRTYLPDLLDGTSLAIAGDLSRLVSSVERRMRELDGPGAQGLAGVSRFLLRSEAIASSRIEGITPSARQVALAELGQTESVRGISEQAQLVANNMTVVREATTQLVSAGALSLDHIIELQRALLPTEVHHHGIRTVQNWIGSSSWTPIGADFVPPAPGRVPALMADLVDYINGAAHSPLIQAALVHAQFETIHPFTDGNGRVGRALIHTVLARRGLMEQAVLPISLVFATLRDRYVAGLTQFRHSAEAGAPAALTSVNAWLRTFTEAAGIAVEQSTKLLAQLGEVRAAWHEQLAAYRTAAGMRAAPRADSAAARVLSLLPEAPVLTATSLTRILNVSFPAASAGLEELRQAGILTTKSIDRGAQAYMARDVLDIVTSSERALASTQFDTRASPPIRPVPARPEDG